MTIDRYAEKLTFITAVMPHALSAIGKQHGWLVRWAIGKAGVECGWNADNVLIRQANNCLGIKAEVNGVPIDGVPSVIIRANTGPEAGKPVYWRKFNSMTECFAELVRMWNDRGPYRELRERALAAFELQYTNGLNAHAAKVANATGAVTVILTKIQVVDSRGRF